MANFSDILNKPASDVNRPKPYPVGTYLCLVSGQPAFNKVGQNQTDCADFGLQILQPQDDVDQASLADMGGVNGKTIRHRLFLTEDAAWRLKSFLVDHLRIDEVGKSLGQLISEAPGKQVYVKLRHRASQDGQQVFSEVESTAAV